MKILYLHIGMQKTGTSSIQMHFMRPNGPLAKVGIDYLPEVIAPRHAHHNVAWEIGKHRRYLPDAPGVAALLKAAAASSSERLFVSTEEFSLFTPGQVKDLARVLKGYDVRPILCLRNQLSWSESLYAQACKRGYLDDFLTFGAMLAENGRLSFDHTVDTWAEAFGPEKLQLLTYESHEDVALAFADLLGVPVKKELSRKNQSLNERFVWASQKLIRQCREGSLRDGARALPPEMEDKVAKALLAIGTKHAQFAGSPVFLGREAGQKYLDPWRQTNERIQKYGPLPEAYFTVPEDHRDPLRPFEIDMILLKEGLFAAPEFQAVQG